MNPFSVYPPFEKLRNFSCWSWFICCRLVFSVLSFPKQSSRRCIFLARFSIESYTNSFLIFLRLFISTKKLFLGYQSYFWGLKAHCWLYPLSNNSYTVNKPPTYSLLLNWKIVENYHSNNNHYPFSELPVLSLNSSSLISSFSSSLLSLEMFSSKMPCTPLQTIQSLEIVSRTSEAFHEDYKVTQLSFKVLNW